MVVERPPAALCEELLEVIVAAAESGGGAAIIGPNGLAFDATYGVEVSAWEEHLAPPPPRTFALALTLDTTWNPALADAESDERVAFESGFKTSVATELGIDTSRV